MVISFFRTVEVDALADWVAVEIQRVLTPSEAEAPGKKKAEQLRKLDLQIAQRVARLVAGGGINFYKKARLGSRVQDVLDGAGYPRSFSKRFVVDLVSLTAVADRKQA